MKERSLTRREFLKGSTALLAASAGGLDLIPRPAGAAGADAPGSVDRLRGFVIADTHIGWVHQDQPSLDTIREAMGRITAKMPDLDVFIDTGDSHHSNVDDGPRQDWTDVVQGGCGAVPLLYVTGNHEVTVWNRPYDTEMRCNTMGSVPCRPYYSFDRKGVHFISLPQLTMHSYVTDEQMAWLELDLEINRDKTTFIFTHNSIAGTTLPHDDLGYRRLANSRQLYDLMKRYPNVVAYMHGHNHTWEIVKKVGKLFVSCGRLGGFNPPFGDKYGRNHIGGIYLEVGRDYVLVRGYSATADKYFDEMENLQHLTHKLEVKTSFDPHAQSCYSYGFGGARDGQRMPVFNHSVLGGGKQEVFLTGAQTPIINDSPDLSVYTQRTMHLWHLKLLPGYSVNPYIHDAAKEDHTWEWLNPGLKLYPPEERKPERVIVTPENGIGERGYYRIAPGRTYRAMIEIEAENPGPKVQMRFRVHDSNTVQHASIDGPQWELKQGSQRLQADFAVPELDDVESIYTNPESDNLLQGMLEIKIMNQTEIVTIKRVELTMADATDGPTSNPTVIIDGKEFRHQGELGYGEVARFSMKELPALRSMVEVKAGGNRKLTWLVRHAGMQWQVRNATVADHGEYFEVGRMRNKFSSRMEVVIAPATEVTAPYVHRLRNVDLARVRPQEDGRIKLELVELLGPAEVDVASSRKPKQVRGADDWHYSDGMVRIKRDKPGTIELTV